MFEKYWVGVLVPERKQAIRMHAWAHSWRSKAKKAAALGNKLIVLEVPKDRLIEILGQGKGVDDPLLFECFFNGQ